MCETCGCGDPEVVPVEIRESLLADNDRRAEHNREHFRRHGVRAVNLMGSPGCGKTALLEATARHLAARVPAARDGSRTPRLAAVSGDLATDHDAERLASAGIDSRSITTGTACHLDARLVHRALHHLDLDDVALFFIENVGNLVCPAIYDLGQDHNVVVLSLTEGEDKPLKYPVMFQRADLVVLTKIDLEPHLPGVDRERLLAHLAQVMPEPRWLALSALTGEGMDGWLDWLGFPAAAAGAGGVQQPKLQGKELSCAP